MTKDAPLQTHVAKITPAEPIPNGFANNIERGIFTIATIGASRNDNFNLPVPLIKIENGLVMSIIIIDKPINIAKRSGTSIFPCSHILITGL